MSKQQRDWIQDRVIARVEQLGLSSLAISQMTGGAVSDDHIRAYITRRKSMGSHKLMHLLRVLGMNIVVEDKHK